jgi:hypothetical protein
MLQAINGAPDQLLESLGRLSKKAGVLATIVLDRTSGSILKTTGTLSLARTSNATGVVPALNTPSAATDEAPGERRGVDEMALMVWNFVNAAGGLVQGLDAEVIRFKLSKVYQINACS